MEYFIGIPYLKDWIKKQVDTYEKQLINIHNLEELNYVKGKLDTLNELTNLFKSYQYRIIKIK